MPQKSLDEIFADYDHYFLPVSDVLAEFANTHNLLIEKYYKEVPMWSLCFSHPCGGHAKLDVIRASEDTVRIMGSWWVDDYAAFSRSLKRGELVNAPLSNEPLLEHLERYLQTVLAWTNGQWSQVYASYRGIWDQTWKTKERFDAAQLRWPKPR
jgi:hypothetical protein